MTTLKKVVITAVFTATIGAGFYGTRQATNAGAEVQTLRQQQMVLAEQIQQFQRERDETSRLLAALREDNQRLTQTSSELARLRSEVTQLRNNPKNAAPISVQSEPINPSIQAEAQSWLNRVYQMRQHLEQAPELKIPELQFLREKDWLRAAEAGTWGTEDYYRKAFKELRATAKVNFGAMIRTALIDFAKANNEMLPSTISELQPYFKTQVEDSVFQRYELAQTGRFDLQSKSTWVVERAAPVDKQFDTRLEVRSSVVTPVNLPDESIEGLGH